MSNAIQFLEAMGKNAAMSRLSVGDYAAAIAGLDADSSQQRALVERDQDALNNLLGGRAKMLFGVFPAEWEETDEDERLESVQGRKARQAS